MIISFISQKGGVGRSTLARATAVELFVPAKKFTWQTWIASNRLLPNGQSAATIA